jgi:hypothetical protein
VRLRAPERSLTLDSGRSKCPATAARTALLAAPSTGDALTHSSSTPSFHEDLQCDARGCTRTVINTSVQPYLHGRHYSSRFEPEHCPLGSQCADQMRPATVLRRAERLSSIATTNPASSATRCIQCKRFPIGGWLDRAPLSGVHTARLLGRPVPSAAADLGHDRLLEIP